MSTDTKHFAAKASTETVEQAVIDWARENDYTPVLVKTQPVQVDEYAFDDGAIAVMRFNCEGDWHVTKITFAYVANEAYSLRMEAVA